MAMCVVRAGRHGDLQAVSDLLPDLVAAVGEEQGYLDPN